MASSRTEDRLGDFYMVHERRHQRARDKLVEGDATVTDVAQKSEHGEGYYCLRCGI